MEHLTFDGDGANPSFVKKRLIDWGAFAEVHEVSSHDIDYRYEIANR